jgi:hypothetical protein
MSLTRLLLTWLALAALMTANGIFRETALKPRMSSAAADAASAALGILIILATTRVAFHPLAGAPFGERLAFGLILVGLTVAFEVVIGLYVDHRSWRELAENYAFWRGRLWPIVLAVLAATPFLWGRSPA